MAQIAHGVMLAHARLDLMEDRLKEAARQAAKDGIDEHIEPVRRVHQAAADSALHILSTLDDLRDVRDDLVSSAREASRDGARLGLDESLEPIVSVHRMAAGTATELLATLQSLTGIEDRIVLATERVATAQIREATDILAATRLEAAGSTVPALHAAARACQDAMEELARIRADLCGIGESAEQESKALARSMEQGISETNAINDRLRREVLSTVATSIQAVQSDFKESVGHLRSELQGELDALAKAVVSLDIRSSTEVGQVQASITEQAKESACALDQLSQAVKKASNDILNSEALTRLTLGQAKASIAEAHDKHSCALAKLHRRRLIWITALWLLTVAGLLASRYVYFEPIYLPVTGTGGRVGS